LDSISRTQVSKRVHKDVTRDIATVFIAAYAY
jgi:hypothetical protein